MTEIKDIRYPTRGVEVLETGANRDIEQQTKFLWQTRSLAIHRKDRPDFNSKEIARVKIFVGERCIRDDIFCLDALGADEGVIYTGDRTLVQDASREKEKDQNQKIELYLEKTSPEDLACWLESNFDPERKSIGAILRSTLHRSKDLELALQDLVQKATTEFNNAESERIQATEEREKARIKSRRNLILAPAAFLLGAVFDFGLLQDEFGFDIPSSAILILLVFGIVTLVLVLLSAAKDAKIFRLPASRS